MTTKKLHQQVKKMFNIARPGSTNVSANAGHGRVVTRKCNIVEGLKGTNENRDRIYSK